MKPPELYQQFTDNELLIYFTLKKHYPDLLFDEDIKQIAAMGLWRACNNYNPSKGAFSTYAVNVIYRQVQRHLFLECRRNKHNTYTFISLDDNVYTDDKGVSVKEKIADKDALSDFEEAETRIDFTVFCNRLKPSQRKVAEMLVNGRTVKEVASQRGISNKRVYQIVDEIKELWNERMVEYAR
ncbi:MAG: sigma-70 family RNA polymerase sigma factor [Sphaerochaetaceae bacterium]